MKIVEAEGYPILCQGILKYMSHKVYILKENKVLSYGSTAISVGPVRKNFL